MGTHQSVGLVSDTHGWLDPALSVHFAGAALIVHAGDVGPASVLDELAEIAPVVAVKGNIDGGPLDDLPREVVVEVAGTRIAVLHVAGSPLGPNRTAAALIDRERPDVLVCGHSHIAVAGRVGRLLWVNPGAAGHEGFHDTRTAAILHIRDDGHLALARINLGPRGRRAAGA